jgi:hypothetical protein
LLQDFAANVERDIKVEAKTADRDVKIDQILETSATKRTSKTAP